MRKVFVCLFVVLLCIVGSHSTFVKGNEMPKHKSQKSVIYEQKTLNGWSEENINQKLLDLGLTIDQISDLTPEAKIEIVKEKKQEEFYLLVDQVTISTVKLTQQVT